MLFYDQFRNKAIFQNIDNVREYFVENSQMLSEIIATIDKDITPDTIWKSN